MACGVPSFQVPVPETTVPPPSGAPCDAREAAALGQASSPDGPAVSVGARVWVLMGETAGDQSWHHATVVDEIVGESILEFDDDVYGVPAGTQLSHDLTRHVYVVDDGSGQVPDLPELPPAPAKRRKVAVSSAAAQAARFAQLLGEGSAAMAKEHGYVRGGDSAVVVSTLYQEMIDQLLLQRVYAKQQRLFDVGNGLSAKLGVNYLPTPLWQLPRIGWGAPALEHAPVTSHREGPAPDVA